MVCSCPAAAGAAAAAVHAASCGHAVETGDMLVLVATASGASLPAGAPPSPAIGTPWRGRGDTESGDHGELTSSLDPFLTFVFLKQHFPTLHPLV